MDYTEYSYLYPPRPEVKITQSQLAFYENRGWVAQYKKNGTCTLIFARGDEVIFKGRHDNNLKAWTPKAMHYDFFKGRSDKWNVYVAELLNDKTPSIKDHLYVFDQLVADGQQLIGTTLIERHAILHDKLMTPDANEEEDLYRLCVGFSIARNLTSSFKTRFDHLKPEDEGLVLKNPKAKLEACFKPVNNTGWQVKSRKLHKNYGF
jgi:hypothetical protein